MNIFRCNSPMLFKEDSTGNDKVATKINAQNPTFFDPILAKESVQKVSAYAKQIVVYKKFLSDRSFNVGIPPMNILVISPILLPNIDGSIDQNTTLAINETYLMGQFDAILLLVDEKTSCERNFSFAKVYKWCLPNFTNLDFAIDAILDSLKQMGAAINDDCLFTIMYGDDSLVERIAKKTQPNNNICFMSSSNFLVMDTFTELSLNIRNSQYGHDYFMEKMAEYMTKTNGLAGNISAGKVNKFKWMHVHWIGKPPPQGFSYQK
ncbi:MAG: hypothetical protein LBD34_03070 [Puniceicoccales bacterium]|nr:hypothetical protein [Puniceicoccales bacterium]